MAIWRIIADSQNVVLFNIYVSKLYRFAIANFRLLKCSFRKHRTKVDQTGFVLVRASKFI